MTSLSMVISFITQITNGGFPNKKDTGAKWNTGSALFIKLLQTTMISR